MDTYRIFRAYSDECCGDSRRRDQKIIRVGLTIAEAQEHCRRDDTSSVSGTAEIETDQHGVKGNWFDGYEKE